MFRSTFKLLAIMLCWCTLANLYGNDLSVGGFEIELTQATPGVCDGALTIEATGSSGPFTVEVISEDGDVINLNLGDSWNVPNLCSGSYRVVFTNEMGCRFEQDPVQISECELEFDENALEEAITNPSTCNSDDGSIYFRFDVPYSGGTWPYTLTLYDNSNNVVPNSFPNSGRWNALSADEYYFITEDAEGCTVRHNFTLGSDIIIDVSFSYDSPCTNESNGEIEAIIFAGSEYEVLWSTGQTEEVLQNIPAGTYCVTVTDALQCEVSDCFQLESVTSTFNLDATITGVCSNRLGSIALSSGGLEGPNSQIDFVWQDNNSTNSYRQNLSVGEYCVEATNCGITVNQCFQVEYENIDPIPIEVESTITPVCFSPISGDGGGKIELDVSGGNGGGFSYRWSNGENTPTITNLFLANYCVTITNEVECITNTERRCFEMDVLDIEINLEDIIHCDEEGCNNASISVNATANYPGEIRFDWYSYLPNGDYYERINALPTVNDIEFSGEYCVRAYMVGGSNSCSATQCYTIEENCINVQSLPDIGSIEVSVWPVSDYFPSGAIFIDYFPGFENTLFTWEGPGGTSNSPYLDPAYGVGEYTLTIDNGCDDPQSRIFNLENCNSNLNVSISNVNSDCANDGYAFITLQLTGVEPNNEYYAWNGSSWVLMFRTGANTPSSGTIGPILIDDGPGNYSIFIRDGSACATEALFTVEEGNLDLTETPFYFMTRSGNGDSWVPIRCDNAIFCGERIVDVRRGSAVESFAIPTGGGGCELRFSCNEQESDLTLRGVSRRGTTPDYTRRQCITGSICEVTEFIDNPIFARISGLEVMPFRVTTSAVLSQESSTPMNSVITIDEQNRCIETLSCEDGQSFLSINNGSAIPSLECVRDIEPWCRSIVTCQGNSIGEDVVKDLGRANVPSGTCCGAIAPDDDSPSKRGLTGQIGKYHIPKRLVKYVDASSLSPLEGYYSLIPEYGSELPPKASTIISDLTVDDRTLKVTPNPFTSKIKVQITGIQIPEGEDYHISIYGIRGNLILNTKTRKSTISMELDNISNGLYIVKVRSKSFMATSKIVKTSY